MRHHEYYMILSDLWERYHQSDDFRKHLRFGQYVINSERLAEVIKPPLPKLFYEVDNKAALNFLMMLGADLP